MLPKTAGPQAGRGTEPPCPDAEPGQVFVRGADVHQLPVQNGGKVGSVDDQVSHPEVAVHQDRGRRGRPAGGQPAKHPFEGGGGVAHDIESLAPLDELVLAGEAGILHPAYVGPVDGGERLRALAQQTGAARRPASTVELTLDAPDDGLAADLIADQKGIAQCGRRIVGDQDAGDRCAGGRGGSLRAGFEFHAGVHVVGWAGAQDQRPALPRRDGVERPCGSACATGECAQVLDRDAGAQGLVEHPGQARRQLR
jgi:hypothetical protein